MVVKLSKKCIFFQFCANLSKRFKSVKAIYIYASESSHYTLTEIVWFIGVSGTVSEILPIKISKKMLNHQTCNKIFQLQTLIYQKLYYIK